MKEIIEKIKKMSVNEAEEYFNSLSEDEKTEIRNALNNTELDDELLEKIAGGSLTFSSGIAQML